MNSSTRTIILAVFLAATVALLFTAPGRKIVNTMSGIPEQNEMPEADGPMFVEFYTDACSICQSMIPTIKQLEEEYSDRVFFLKIDANNAANMNIAEKFEITGVPEYFWITSNKEILNSGVGGVSMPAMKQAFEELLMHESGHPEPEATGS